jgi:hypothetical protein
MAFHVSRKAFALAQAFESLEHLLDGFIPPGAYLDHVNSFVLTTVGERTIP